MTNVLLLLPASGANFGGGLFTFNQQLAIALAQEKERYSVKVAVLQLPDKPTLAIPNHGLAEVIELPIPPSETIQLDPDGKLGDGTRKQLYSIMNKYDPDAILKRVAGTSNWTPSVIIGHSRFSGPAAICLQQKIGKDAQSVYFVHSIPVEGKILVGQSAFEEAVDPVAAEEKLTEERTWMPRASVVAAVGPLIRQGIDWIFATTGKRPARIFDCIPGTDIITPSSSPVATASSSTTPVTNSQPASSGAKALDVPKITTRQVVPADAIKLVFLGRAGAAIKGLQELLLVVLGLNEGLKGQEPPVLTQKLCIDVRYWGDLSITVPTRSGNSDATSDGKTYTMTQQPTVSAQDAQNFIDDLLLGSATTAATPPSEPSSSESVKEPTRRAPQVAVCIEPKLSDPLKELPALNYKGLLMPSYIEHYGLVPFEGLTLGLPVLVNEFSGAALFLQDTARVGIDARNCVVADMTGGAVHPLVPADLFAARSPDMFEKKPECWAEAVEELLKNHEQRLEEAEDIRKALNTGFKWSHMVEALFSVLSKSDTGLYIQVQNGNLSR